GINLNHRFTPAAYLAKKWVDEKKLGHLLFCHMSMWIKNPAESSPYFQIKALHPHTVDVMRYFCGDVEAVQCFATKAPGRRIWSTAHRSEEHTSELQSRSDLVCRLLLEKKKRTTTSREISTDTPTLTATPLCSP